MFSKHFKILMFLEKMTVESLWVTLLDENKFKKGYLLSEIENRSIYEIASPQNPTVHEN